MITEVDRENYCKDCKRSIYGEYRDCDINIENNGRYVGPGVNGEPKCGCKVVDVNCVLKIKEDK